MEVGGYSMLKAPLYGSESRNQYPPLTKTFNSAIGGLITSDHLPAGGKCWVSLAVLLTIILAKSHTFADHDLKLNPFNPTYDELSN